MKEKNRLYIKYKTRYEKTLNTVVKAADKSLFVFNFKAFISIPL